MQNGFLNRFVLLLVVVFVCSFVAQAQAAKEIRRKTWNTENGLPQNTVNGIIQTPDGYIWVATLDGLARFDGNRFTVFKKSNTPELPMNRIRYLNLDSAGRLWIYTEDEKTIVVYENRKFRTFKRGVDFETDVFLQDWGELNEIQFQYGPDTQYVFTGDGFERRQGVPDARSRVWYDPEGRAWIDTGDTRTIADVNGSQVSPKVGPLPIKERQLSLTTAVEANGYLWFFVPVAPNEFPLFRFRLSDGKLERTSIRSKATRFFQKDRAGDLWIGHFYEGIDIVRASDLSSPDPLQLMAERITLGDYFTDTIQMARTDRDGNTWLGSLRGLHLLMEEPAVTYHSRKTGLPFENMYATVEDREGTIWFAGWDNSLMRYADGKFTSEWGKFVSALFVDRDGRVWVYDADSKTHVKYRSPGGDWIDFTDSHGNALSATPFQVIAQDRDGNMWFGGENGLVRYRSGEFENMTGSEGLPSPAVTSSLLTSSGEMWFGTIGGPVRFDGERFHPFAELPRTFVRTLYEDGEGVIWIGTYDSGLIRYKNGKFSAITSAHGLFSDGVFCILEDDAGWFWMNSNQGIYRVQKKDLNDFADGLLPTVTSISYGPEDGLLNVEGNGGKQPAGLKASDGKLWIPTAGGMAVIDPKKVRQDATPPPVIIESTSVDRTAIDPALDAVRVEPEQTALDIVYTAVNFRRAENVRFRYRLEGLDEAWTEAGSRRTANFAHLPYGEYTFRVIAASPEGVWNTTGAALRVHVVPPFYRTAPFYVLAIAALVSLLAGLYIFRVRQLQAINEAQSEFARLLIDSQETERRRIALELHDSLGQSLAVIRNRALMSLETPDQHQRLVDQMREISEASVEALEETRKIAHNLHPAQLEHLGLPAALSALVDSVNDSTAVNVSAKIDDVSDGLSSEAAINLYRIVQESLGNVIKHSSVTQASVSMFRDNGNVVTQINDNGRGFNSGLASGGLGLKGIRERASILGADLEIDSTPGKGTRITVLLRHNSHDDGSTD